MEPEKEILSVEETEGSQVNLLEVMKNAVEPFLDQEKPPLHVGEVMNLWFYLAATEQTLRGEQVACNTVRNEELRKQIEDIRKIHLDIRSDLLDFLHKEGIPEPKSTPMKNRGAFPEIPDDARLSDEEAAVLVSENVVMGINSAAKGLTESVRADVGALFAKFLMQKTAFSVNYKAFLLKQGWLLIPPAYRSEQTRPQ